MKQPASDSDWVTRWRERPEGGTSDEDRAAALMRDALLPGAFPEGLDDARLSAIAGRLKTERRARPPFWLRPVLVAALLTVSVASVMGVQGGWFAQLRDRLPLRRTPSAAPEPLEHTKGRAARWQTAPVEGQSPARADIPAADVAAADGTSPPVSAPVAPAAKSPTAPAIRKLAVVDSRPLSPTAAARAEPPAASAEVQALEHAMGLLRGKHDAPAALAALDDYAARFPNGVLAPEARVARVDALLMLDRADDALRALEALPLDAHRRSTELQLIRGELRARTDCGRAEADFTAVLTQARTPALEERALYGRATCRSTLGNSGGAADDLRHYVDRFPKGGHADWARRWLENNQ